MNNKYIGIILLSLNTTILFAVKSKKKDVQFFTAPKRRQEHGPSSVDREVIWQITNISSPEISDREKNIVANHLIYLYEKYKKDCESKKRSCLEPADWVNLQFEFLDAVDESSINKVKSLLATGNVDVNFSSIKNQTALHMALAKDPHSYDIVESLINAGADVNTATSLNQTPLLFATFKNNIPLIKLLIKHNANPFIAGILGMTPLMLAKDEARKNKSDTSVEMVKILSDYEDNYRKLNEK